MKFIIEHLEPRLFKWCIVEYTHIFEIVGKKNLLFTNITEKQAHKLEKLGKVMNKSVKELKLKNSCILDPFATEILSKKDNKFDYIILGGILGDYPMRKRTKKELTQPLGIPARNLGRKQMSTDTASLVAVKLLSGKKLGEIKFTEKLEVDICPGESIILPFRYVTENGKPILAKGYMDLIKKKKPF